MLTAYVYQIALDIGNFWAISYLYGLIMVIRAALFWVGTVYDFRGAVATSRVVIRHQFTAMHYRSEA